METNTLAVTSQAQTRASALNLMASRFSVEPAKLLETLKSTVFKGANNEELLALVVVSNEYGLNPLTKEIYAFSAKGGGIVPIVSIDGWIRMMNDHPQFDGIEYEWIEGKDGKPESCTAIIWRKDRTRPVKVTEYFSECFRATEPWKQMPHRMMRHKATMQGGRVAFGFSGIQDEDEAADTMKRADAKDVTPSSRPDFSKPIPPAELAPIPSESSDEIPGLERQAPAEAEFVADTAQKQIAIALADSDIKEADFISFVRKNRPDLIPKGVQMISAIDNLRAATLLDVLPDILGEMAK